MTIKEGLVKGLLFGVLIGLTAGSANILKLLQLCL